MVVFPMRLTTSAACLAVAAAAGTLLHPMTRDPPVLLPDLTGRTSSLGAEVDTGEEIVPGLGVRKPLFRLPRTGSVCLQGRKLESQQVVVLA